ncbi:MAG: NADH-quinone oxidoreductase subunit C [Chloroflexi bacterium]|nr:NADH-quinone oxidoreductase subunit C [Chloroflexota bacterium]MDA1173150.1 NADH-quinone oxidoreductase subunit C [Chloroflexota bacterium]
MTTAVSGSDLAEVLGQRLFHSVTNSDAGAAWVTPEALLDVCRFLHDDRAQAYDLLSSVTAVDYVEFFDVVYHLTSIARNAATVLKVRLYGRDAPTVASVTSVWAGADLQEREIYDLLGVTFTGHPNLKRMLTWEGFQGHPLRRDYLEPPLPYTWPHGG